MARRPTELPISLSTGSDNAVKNRWNSWACKQQRHEQWSEVHATAATAASNVVVTAAAAIARGAAEARSSATTNRETGMPEEQPQGFRQTSQQRGFDPSIYRPVSMGGLVKMPTAQKAGSMPEPSEEEAAIDPALARIVEMLNKPSTSCGSPISKRPSSPRNRSTPGSRFAHQAVSLRRNESTPARLAQQSQQPAERRYDTDGGLYTKAEFVGYYGGPAEWKAARRQQQPQLAQEGQLQRPPPLQSTSSRLPCGACILSAPSQPSPLQGTWPAGGAASHPHQAEPAFARLQPQPKPKPQPSPPPNLNPNPIPNPNLNPNPSSNPNAKPKPNPES